MNIKIRWLRDKLRTQNLQGMIVSNPINIRYLTDIEAEGILLITLKENIFITDSRYVESVNAVLTASPFRSLPFLLFILDRIHSVAITQKNIPAFFI